MTEYIKNIYVSRIWDTEVLKEGISVVEDSLIGNTDVLLCIDVGVCGIIWISFIRVAV